MFAFKYNFRNAEHLKSVQMPITIFHGTNDFVVPIKGSIKLKESLKTDDSYVTLEGGTHNDIIIFDQYQERLSQILE